ncbi:MAG: hypothetical protein IPH11_04830 [Ignavibacteriales bacterium]|nr:hypothetical protein [Ignavibacteriales bacterium]
MQNTQTSFVNQLIEKQLRNGRIAIYTKVNNFKCGELDLNDSTFYCAHRSSKNIMRMFNNGLGINEQILSLYNFTFIVIPFNDSVLKTSRIKWLKEGILSPFYNTSVDRQIILPLNKINLQESFPVQDQSQLTLFQGLG